MSYRNNNSYKNLF